MSQVFALLDKLNIEYRRFEHPALFRVEDGREYRPQVENLAETKNLFLRNRQGNRHYLMVMDAFKQLDFRSVEAVVGEKVGLASPERLKKYLNLTPGSVSPFGLLNDSEREVILLVEQGLLAKENIGFHPNDNRQTVVLKTLDWWRAMESLGYEIKKIVL